MLWKSTPSLKDLQDRHKDTAVEQLGIEFTEIGAASLSARMPVDRRTVQPYGILHGGASVVLAETLGSCAASLCLDSETQYCVGLDINANHVRSARTGFVTGTATAVHIGRTTHVWAIEIRNDEGKMVCVSRITMSILSR
ncbi:hotdog fold thioesterase [Cupriavidus sp. CV2]|uniref:hotdog fold thioesterase n=1 Tax=Cupriavidus ulmosensis TaxID=3065913 RepID=UPI00296ABC6A|nr:hotdog fold thioesterase [Cupriavidus sp. CV2]MDW3683976.1 hotdog fold thioesterase [Cupriavidus sp. CV2]